MSVRFGRLICALLILSCVCGIFAQTAHAETLVSPNYKLIESDVGAGGLVQSSSANYKSVLSVSDTAVGDSSSASYTTKAGSQTTPDPALSFVINDAAANFSSLFSPTLTATATNTFSVINYTSYGYTVQIVGHTPSNGSHSIAAMGTDDDGGPESPILGKEQFGMNMVANTQPISFGANPDNGQFGFGTVNFTGSEYNTANKYRYVSGETIASAPKSSGQTTYTISYIVNVASLTPGGQYTSDQQIVVIGTY